MEDRLSNEMMTANHTKTANLANGVKENLGFQNDEPKRKLSTHLLRTVSEEDEQKPASALPRRKSILHNGSHLQPPGAPTGIGNTQHNSLNHVSKSTTKTDTSWLYLLCIKCRQKETGPGWEPGYWQRVCPYPFCPTYRHIARTLSLFLIFMLTWGIAFTIIGKDALPGGGLFEIALLVIVCHFGGYLFKMCNLPALAGTLFTGILYQNLGLFEIHEPYIKMCGILRKIALVIILTRAGLDLDSGTMRRLMRTTLTLGLVPWFIEAGVIMVMAHFLLDMPWMWGVLLGCVVAAVSPAVVVGALMRLRDKGYGVAKGIPTLVIAISGIDDAISVAAFYIVSSLMFSNNSTLYNIILGPLSVVGGICFGVAWGLLTKYVPEKGDPFVVPMRVLMLFGGGMIAVMGSGKIGLAGAGPLGVVAAAFVSSWGWSSQGWDVEHNPVVTAFEIFWMIFEPILFSLTGTQIQIDELDPEIFTIGIGILLTACIIRILGTVLVAYGGVLNLKEKFFIALSCMAKASVQAALAPAALDIVMAPGSGLEKDHHYADVVLMVCVLSIVLTAPTGAIIILLSGPRLLTKAVSAPPSAPPPRHRPSYCPSMRDLAILEGEGGVREVDSLERRISVISQRKKSTEVGERKVSTVQPPQPCVMITHEP